MFRSVMHSLSTPVALVAIALLASAPGCKDNQKKNRASASQPAPVALSGLDAIPSSVTALISLDAVELQRSWLVRRAVTQMFARDRELESRIDELLESCEIDLKGGVSDILMGLGSKAGATPGTEEAVMVVTGKFVEAKLASCIGQSVAGDGRSLIADKLAGRTLYGVRGGPVAPAVERAPDAPEGDLIGLLPPAPLPAPDSRPAAPSQAHGVRVSDPAAPEPTPEPTEPPAEAPGTEPETAPQAPPRPPEPPAQTSLANSEVWFSVTAPDTLVVATSKDWLIAAVDDGDKLAAAPEMMRLIERADRQAAVWMAGQMSPAIGLGLVETSKGKIAAPPRAIFGSLDFRTGVKLTIGVELVSEKDASELKSLAGKQMGVLALAAQTYGLGEWMGKLGVDAEDKTVYLRVTLDDTEVREILSRIDTAAGSAQNPADNRGEP